MVGFFFVVCLLFFFLGCGHLVSLFPARRVLVSSASSHNRSNLLFTLVTQGSSKGQWIAPFLCCFHLICSGGHPLFFTCFLLSALLW